jgi:hypothetical protein
MPTMPIAMIRTTTVTATTKKITTTKTTKIIKKISNTTTIIQHALSSKGKKTINNKKLQIALEEKHNINNDNQNIITKQDYVPEIAISLY